MGMFARSWRCCRHYTRRALLARWIGGQILLGRLWWRSSRAPRVRWSWTEIYIDHVDRYHCNCQSHVGGHVTCPCSLNAPLRRSTAGSLLQPTSTLDSFFFKLENLPSSSGGDQKPLEDASIRSKVRRCGCHSEVCSTASRIWRPGCFGVDATCISERTSLSDLDSLFRFPFVAWWWKNMVQVVFGPPFFAKLI